MSKNIKILLYTSLVFAITGLGVLGFWLLKTNKKQIDKQKTAVSAPIVQTAKVKTGEQSVLIIGEGTVTPEIEIALVPQVGGKIQFISPSLVNGGEFKKGDILLRIEPIDYELAVTLAKAKVKSSESLLQLAEQQTEAAREEWRIHYADGTEKNTPPPPLVAKEPQLAAAKARLDADKADLDKALLNLERTELKAPFNGRVSRENVDIGQYVAPGQNLATLYSIDAAEIVIPLEKDDLFWFHVPGFTPGNDRGSPATVLAEVAGQALSWQGEVVRAEGKLDERTRMIDVVVRVNKPYEKKPPLALGLFVTVHIKGRTLANVALIPRSALRPDRLVWVVNGDRLHFRKVETARFQGDDVIITSGLREGEMVVVTTLKVVTNGMAVRALPVNKGGGS